MKKRGFGAGLWNGTGGKIVEGESAKETAKREVMEEFGVEVEIIDLLSLGKIDFVFKDGLNYKVYIFVCKKWRGEPSESEEMKPRWFSIDNLPWDNMWSDDKFWLPKIIEGKSIEGRFYFNNDGKTIEKFDIKDL